MIAHHKQIVSTFSNLSKENLSEIIQHINNELYKRWSVIRCFIVVVLVVLRLPIGEWATPRSGNHSASRHRGIQRLRDVEPGCIVLYLELHGRAIALAGVEPSEILHTPNNGTTSHTLIRCFIKDINIRCFILSYLNRCAIFYTMDDHILYTT